MIDADAEALPSDDPAFRGQAAYTEWNLRFRYDIFVLLISNHLAWRCSTRSLMRWYERHLSNNHLDVGVGTGYFPANWRFTAPDPRLVLMDVNPCSLRHAAQRARHHRPELLRRNVLQPIAFDGPRFDSISVNYLLHCLPGAMHEKAAALTHLCGLLQPGGVIFGATILSREVPVNRFARRLIRIYNAKGFFSNAQDSVSSLRRALDERFSRVELRVEGCVAKFAGWR